MNSDQFIRAIKAHVRDSAIRNVISAAENPPGRKVPDEKVALSIWFRTLKPDDRNNVEMLVRDAANRAIFGLLAVLDGERTIDSADEGQFELRFVKHGHPHLLTGPDVSLHDLYNAPD